jgi:hypothetical protein
MRACDRVVIVERAIEAVDFELPTYVAACDVVRPGECVIPPDPIL